MPDSLKDDMVIQKYINKPYLLNGFKFDLRVYVVVLGIPSNDSEEGP